MPLTPLRSPLARRPAPWLWQPRRWMLALVWALWVLATLAPGLSRLGAHARATRSDWVEVCTSHGMAWVRVDATDPVADPTAGLLALLEPAAHPGAQSRQGGQAQCGADGNGQGDGP